jgi:hypothetical protein
MEGNAMPNTFLSISKSAVEARARRAAGRYGLFAKKSRWRAGTSDNHGGFMLIESLHNRVVAGERFDLTAEEVLVYCSPDTSA